MMHELKCWTGFFDMVWAETKLFELRREDRNFKVGDTLLLVEIEIVGEKPTGRSLMADISCLVQGDPWLAPGYCCLGLRDIRNRTAIG